MEGCKQITTSYNQKNHFPAQIRRESERKQSWNILRYYDSIHLEGERNTKKSYIRLPLGKESSLSF
jgi:hypothetical protein